MAQDVVRELLALPPRIRDAHTLGVQTNLTLSIRTIDCGPGVLSDSGYDLTTLRLGALMHESGYEPAGADPDRSYSGIIPWFGSIPDVERRIADLQKQRDEARARLDEALLDEHPPVSKFVLGGSVHASPQISSGRDDF